MPATFGGKTYYIPQVDAFISEIAGEVPVPSTDYTLLIVGESVGGEKGKIYEIEKISDLTVLQGGDLWQAGYMALNPSPESLRPRLLLLKVNNSSPSSIKLPQTKIFTSFSNWYSDATVNNSSVFSLQSVFTGKYTKEIQIYFRSFVNNAPSSIFTNGSSEKFFISGNKVPSYELSVFYGENDTTGYTVSSSVFSFSIKFKDNPSSFDKIVRMYFVPVMVYGEDGNFYSFKGEVSSYDYPNLVLQVINPSDGTIEKEYKINITNFSVLLDLITYLNNLELKTGVTFGDVFEITATNYAQEIHLFDFIDVYLKPAGVNASGSSLDVPFFDETTQAVFSQTTYDFLRKVNNTSTNNYMKFVVEGGTEGDYQVREVEDTIHGWLFIPSFLYTNEYATDIIYPVHSDVNDYVWQLDSASSSADSMATYYRIKWDIEGTTSSATFSDWQNALETWDNLNDKSIRIVVPLSTDEGVLTLFKNAIPSFIDQKKEFMLIFGMPYDDTTDQDKIRTFLSKWGNNERIILVVSASKFYDEKGILRKYDGYIHSAMIGSAQLGVLGKNPERNTITMMKFNVTNTSASWKMTFLEEIDRLGGVIISKHPDDPTLGYFCLHGRTSYKIGNNLLKSEILSVLGADIIKYDVRKIGIKYLGKLPSARLDSRLVSEIQRSVLNYHLAKPPRGTAIISKITKPVSIQHIGDVILVSFGCEVMTAGNYIFFNIELSVEGAV